MKYINLKNTETKSKGLILNIGVTAKLEYL